MSTMCRKTIQIPIFKRLLLFSEWSFWPFFLNYHQRLVSITKNCLHVNHAQKIPTVILRFVTRNGYQLLLYFICDIYKMTYKLQTIENFTFYFVIFKILFFSRWILVRVVTRLNERAFFINKKKVFFYSFL